MIFSWRQDVCVFVCVYVQGVDWSSNYLFTRAKLILKHRLK